MKHLSIVLSVLSLALMMSCSKEDEDEVVVVDDPVIPVVTQELTGEFEGQWGASGCRQNGKIVVNDGYIFIDELPTSIAVRQLITDMRDGCRYHPEVEAIMKDSIGNFFFANTYKYPTTDLEIKYKLNSYSDGVYSTSILSMKNKWSDITTTISIEKEPPYPSDTIVIDAPEANCISFRVEADSVPYRVDLVCKGKESTAKFNMTTGLWKFDYWFSSYRIINLQTGQQINIGITWELGKVTIGETTQKEDTNLLRFQANNRTGSAEERRSSYYN